MATENENQNVEEIDETEDREIELSLSEIDLLRQLIKLAPTTEGKMEHYFEHEQDYKELDEQLKSYELQ